MARARATDAFVNLALIGAGLLVLALLYGLAARTFVPRTTPVRDAAASPVAEGSLGGDLIQVEVRNGTLESGLAGRTTQYLRRRGFDVVANGNYSSREVEESVVLDRVSNPEAARRVARALGLPESRVRVDPDTSLMLDVSVVVGADYPDLEPFADETLADETAADQAAADRAAGDPAPDRAP
jgi:LytR cell envelope-related transcriptional attenuator